MAFTANELPACLATGNSVDNRIIAVALESRQANPDAPVILVSKDVNLRIRADAMGLLAEDYDAERVETPTSTRAWSIEKSGEEIDRFYSTGSLSLPDPYFCPTSSVHLKNPLNPSQTALGKINLTGERIVPIMRMKDGVWGIRPRNKEQAFALDLLMNDNIDSVTFVGKASTGKTLLAIAAGLQKTARRASISASWCRAQSCPLAATSVISPATSRRRSLLGCSRSTTTSSSSWACPRVTSARAGARAS